jgi:serine/threonine protein kinase
VAIKILPTSFARDPARMARFEREAKVLASLDHAYIAQIYGSSIWRSSLVETRSTFFGYAATAREIRIDWWKARIT